jgi:hypothetical protein
LQKIGAIVGATQAPDDKGNVYKAFRLGNVSKHHIGLSRNITKPSDQPGFCVFADLFRAKKAHSMGRSLSEQCLLFWKMRSEKD